MCLPVLAIAGIAASLAGAGMNYMGQRKAESAMNSTFNKERSRQKGFEAEQNAKFQDSLAETGKVTDPAEAAKAAAAREAALSAATKSAAPAAEGYLPGSGSAPAIVAEAGAKAGAKADAATANLAAALGRIGGVNDQMMHNNIAIARNSQAIDQLHGFKRGSLDVLSAEMEAAKRKGQTLRTLGSLAQTIGGAMSMGSGLAGSGAAAVGGTTAAGGVGASTLGPAQNALRAAFGGAI